MNETQPELDLSTPKPAVETYEIDLLKDTLKGRAWVFAKTLQSELALSDRKIRAIAEASEGAILSGQKGYRLLDETVSIEDVTQTTGWFRSQAKRMLKRATDIDRRYHRYAKPL